MVYYRKPSEPLALLNLLDALDAFNAVARQSKPEPYPEGTSPIQVDWEVATLVSRQMMVPVWVVWELFQGVPVKQMKMIRDWVLKHVDADDTERRRMLRNYHRDHIEGRMSA